MAYVDVPKDLTRVKSKVFFNLTKRQLVCFGVGALVGIPLFFLTRGPLGSTVALTLMTLVLLPAMLFGLYEKNGQPLEVMLRNIVRSSILRPKARPYRTENFYAAIQRQERFEQEVKQIVQKERKTEAVRGKDAEKADRNRTQTDRGSNRQGQKRR
jgi:hypothetical protein